MNNKETIAVIGLGYVGLPLATLCATKGFDVVGLDTNQEIINLLQQGKSHIKDDVVEKSLNEAVKSGHFNVTTTKTDISACTHFLICVPTPINANQEPDLEPLLSAVKVVAPCLKANDLVVVESTIFPGTCEQVVIPLLESLSKLKAGDDFHVAHCPERVNPGDLFWTSENIPRVVGSTSEKGAKIAANLYSSILGGPIFNVRDIKSVLKPKFTKDENGQLVVAQLPLGSVTIMKSIRDAEAVKAMENTVRDVNIAFVNELAKISDVLQLDVVDIIDGMATKPFGKGPFYPGIGVGGHCIAVDPEWLKAASKRAGYMPEMIQLSRETNNSMPYHAVSLMQDLLNNKGYPVNGTQIALLGVAYKRNVDDLRESPFFEVKSILEKKKAVLKVYDSWVTHENNVDSLVDALKGSKVLIIITEHTDIIDELKSLDLAQLGIEIVIDGRNCLDPEMFQHSDILYHGIGRRE